ncbi:hypothetical protein AMECASPLE_001678, partial [Ameca splendens]
IGLYLAMSILPSTPISFPDHEGKASPHHDAATLGTLCSLPLNFTEIFIYLPVRKKDSGGEKPG